ncbi:MAG: nicotinate-nucleotide--dimethylbenzimidazole phosphoribosyltransferase [Candidatus Symbiobacter sp.]|nr:nicotinate-nucleotide--dimethylbenzimidazole phosphoribosyltransferase [Candidatus Symbiobacter sp.]
MSQKSASEINPLTSENLSFAEIRRILKEMPGPDLAALAATQAREQTLTKPAGSLGRLEEIAQWLAAWQRRHPPRIDHPRVAVFAGNHGVVAQGVSAYPPEVTQQMVANFNRGGAAINQLCRQADADLRVYEMNLAAPVHDFTEHSAMAEEECVHALAYGMMAVEPGIDLLALGEMGIGNSCAAAALCLALFGGDAVDWTGHGTGIDATQLKHKQKIVAAGVARHQAHQGEPLALLADVGGREFAAMIGAIIAARYAGVPVILDGFAGTAAAAVLYALSPGYLDHCLVAHCSAERGHRKLLDIIGKIPLFNFNMRLGEGSGAALAIPILRAASLCHSGMASFAEAQVTEKKSVR